ncbi:MAG: redoxin family protein [Leptospiraceae bacterium]|nr:redoxin family protein [Leptospiraceae bacterium]
MNNNSTIHARIRSGMTPGSNARTFGKSIRRQIIILACSMLMSMLVFAPGCSGEPGEAQIRPINRAQLTALLQEHRSRPILLNFWATWCTPCMPELHTLARLAASEDVTVIAVAMDDPDVDRSIIEGMYASLSGPVIGCISTESEPAELVADIDSDWPDVVPMTYLIDADGNIQERLAGKRSLHRLESMLTSTGN